MHSPLPVLGRGEPERYESPAQVASDLNVSLLGALARAESEWTPPLVLPDLIDPEAPYDAVADRIELLAGQMPLKLLGCIGLGDDPLRYRLAANLAARLARTGARVTLVEAELHAPLLQADKNRREGLVDMLLYGCSFAAVARESGIPGVKVVGAGSHLWSGEPIHGDEWERVLGALRAGSDFTLVTTTTGLPAPILGMLIRRLDSIVIAYALERASREAVRRSYLALWDMDAPILGLVTEGPHLAGTARAAGADRATAPPTPLRKAPEAPPQIGADWASRLLGEPLAPGVSPMTEEVEVVIRQTSEVDAAAAALWEKEVERLRSILTAPDGVAPFLDAEAPPPAEPEESAFESAWTLADAAPPAVQDADEPSIPHADEPAIASGAEPSDDLGLDADSIAEPAPDHAPTESEPAPRSAGAVQDWGAAIGAEIAAWGTAGPADEPRPSAKIQGLERITIVAEDTFFSGSRAGESPAGGDSGSGMQPPPDVPADSMVVEPEDAIEDAAHEAPWTPPPAPATMANAFASPPAPPVPPVPPAVPFAEEAIPPVPPPSPRSEVSSAAEEAANWFARLDGARPSTPPTPPVPEGRLTPVPPLNLGRPPIEASAPPEPEIELGARLTFQSNAPEPALPFAIERTPAPEPPPPVLEPIAEAEPEELVPEPVEPTPAEATFPWHQPETAAEDEEEVAFWPNPSRTTDPLPADGAVSADDLTVIQDIEQELVGAAAAAAAPVAVADDPPPSRTPWRVMVIGCLVGLAAVGLWAYQSGMIRLEPPPPRSSSNAIKEAPAEPRTAQPAAETHAPPSNSAPAPEPAPVEEATTAAGGSGPGAAEPPAQPGTGPTAQSSKVGSSAAKGTVATSGMSLDTALGSQSVTPAAGKTAVPPPARTTTPETRPSASPAAPAPAGAKPASNPAAPASPATSTPTSDVRLVGDTPAGYGVHVSSFKTESIAQNDLARFRALGYPGIIVSVEVPGRGIWQRVVLGPYDSPSEAEAMAAAVRAAGLSEKAQSMRLKP